MDTEMTKRQLDKFRAELEKKLSEIEKNSALRSELITERSNDPMDQMQSRQDLDLTIHTIDSAWRTWKAVDTALTLLGDGEYGICLECGEDINPKRLAAIPWTTLCVSCQEERDLTTPTAPESKFERAA